ALEKTRSRRRGTLSLILNGKAGCLKSQFLERALPVVSFVILQSHRNGILGICRPALRVDEAPLPRGFEIWEIHSISHIVDGLDPRHDEPGRDLEGGGEDL